jgi:hypothetical protein
MRRLVAFLSRVTGGSEFLATWVVQKEVEMGVLGACVRWERHLEL